MEFQDLVLEKMQHIIDSHKLLIAEKRDNYIRFESKCLIFCTAYNPRERSCILFIYKNQITPSTIEINNDTLKYFFKSTVELSDVPVNTFLNNLVLFLENEGSPLLSCDPIFIHQLEQFSYDRNKMYTENLLQRQSLEKIDNAWSSKNYNEFVALMDKVDTRQLPAYYMSRYTYAHKHRN